MERKPIFLFQRSNMSTELTELTDSQRAFLNAYRATGRMLAAAELLGISCETHFHALRESEVYRKAFAVTQRESANALEEETRYRAVDGSEHPVYQGGELVGHWQKRSDKLLMYLLSANNPAKFRKS